jgi:hypothetical protein
MLDDLFDAAAPPVKRTEAQRIVSLPVVRVPTVDGAYAGPDLTQEFARPGTGARLRDVQSWALHTLRTHRRAVLAVGVGHGKTLIGYAAARALGIDAARVVVLLPAATRATFVAAGEHFASLFDVPSSLTVLSYEDLSSPDKVGVLRLTRPALIYADEAHKLRNADSIRTKRLFDYLDEFDDCLFVPASGTLFKRSILDAAPLLLRALRDGSPLPSAYTTLQMWASCIDVPRGADYLEDSAAAWFALRELVKAFGDGDRLDNVPLGERRTKARAAFHARLRSTPGVVITRDSSCDASLYMQPCALDLPVDLTAAAAALDATWTRPDGEELEDSLRVVEAQRQLALGFCLTWDWGAAGRDDEWLTLRREWARALRGYLKSGRAALDSPALVERTLRNGDVADFPVSLTSAWCAWQAVADRAAPVTVPIILSREPMRRIVAHVKATMRRGLIWYAHDAEAALLQECGVAVVPLDKDPVPSHDGPQAVSIAAHREGRNFQAHFHENFVLSPPANGESWQQLLARTHRPGQPQDEVWCAYLEHTPEFERAVEQAKKDAVFAEAVSGESQRLNRATWLPTVRIG